jgi:hypothetical protein
MSSKNKNILNRAIQSSLEQKQFELREYKRTKDQTCP